MHWKRSVRRKENQRTFVVVFVSIVSWIFVLVSEEFDAREEREREREGFPSREKEILLVREEQRFDRISFRVPKQAMNELVGSSSL